MNGFGFQGGGGEGEGIVDTPQAWSLTINFDKNYGSFNTNDHIQTGPQTYAINWTGAVFGAVTHRIEISNGDTFTFPPGYDDIDTNGATGTKVLNVFTPIADRRYRISFECIDVANQKYNVFIKDAEKTAQLNAPVLSSATLDSGLDIDVIYKDTNTYPSEVQVEIQTDTVNTFDSGNEFSNYAAKDSITDKITCPNYSTEYFFRIRAVGDGINTQTSNWSNIRSATTGIDSDIILMQDDFAGTTIDTGKWVEVDPNSHISQNDGLIFDISSSSITARTHYLESLVDDTGQPIICVQATFSNLSYFPSWWMSLWENNTSDNEITILATATNVARIIIRDNGSTVYDYTSTISILNTFKIEKNGNYISCYYWSGSAWVQFGVTQEITYTNIFKAALVCLCGTSGTGTVEVNDFFMNNYIYSTSQP